MTKYTVAFIDDDNGNIQDFILDAENHDLNVKVFKLTTDLNTLTTNIINYKVDAIVVDFQLNETRTDIKYDGSDVLNILYKKTSEIPMFIFTAHGPDAEEEASDINIVYFKDSPIFFDRVYKQIEKSKKRISEYQNEIHELLSQHKERDLSLKEEERIIELDSILEQTINKEAALPETLKQPSTIKRIDKLLFNADELIKQLEILNKNE